MPNLFAALIGLATFAALCGGYALFRSYVAADERLARETLARETRKPAGEGFAIGGYNRPGEN